MFFAREDKLLRIDFVLVYDVEKFDPAKEKQRKTFERNLTDVGVFLEHDVGTARFPTKHMSKFRGRLLMTFWNYLICSICYVR